MARARLVASVSAPFRASSCAWPGVSAVASPVPDPSRTMFTSPARTRNSHFGDISRLVIARLAGRPDAIRVNGCAVPTVIPEDTISLGNHMPAFDVAKVGAVGGARPYVPGFKFRLQLSNLRVGECHHFVLTVSTGLGLLSLSSRYDGTALEFAKDSLADQASAAAGANKSQGLFPQR